jgi:hypothetical protein
MEKLIKKLGGMTLTLVIVFTTIFAGETTVSAYTHEKVDSVNNRYSVEKITADTIPTGQWAMEVSQMYYQGYLYSQNLYLEICVANNTGKTITSLKNIEITVPYANGDTYTTYKQDQERLTIKSGQTKTFTISIYYSNLDGDKQTNLRPVLDLKNDIGEVSIEADACGPAKDSKTANSTVSISRKDLTLYAGKSYSLKINNATSKIKWSSSNKKVATVSSKGKVRGKIAGTAVITAKTGKSTMKCRVVVSSASYNGYTLTITNKSSKKCKYLVIWSSNQVLNVGGDAKNSERIKTIVCGCGLRFTKSEPFNKHESSSGHGHYTIRYTDMIFTLENNKTAVIQNLKKNTNVRVYQISDSTETGTKKENLLSYSLNNGAVKSMGIVQNTNWMDGITDGLAFSLKKNSSVVVYNTETALKKYKRFRISQGS